MPGHDRDQIEMAKESERANRPPRAISLGGGGGTADMNPRDFGSAMGATSGGLHDTYGGVGGGSPVASRISTRELLFSRAKELHEKAAKMEALARLVPETLYSIDPRADAALWDLVQGIRIY